jgi:hypothetical protein
MNSGTVTVHGLEGLVMRNPNSTSQSVAVRLYLHDLNSSNLPVMPAIDSVLTSVSVSTAGVWVGANFTTPRTVTANFAVSFRIGSSIAGDTLRMFLNNAYEPTAAGSVPKFGEAFGLLRYGTPTNWVKTTGLFGTGTDHEFVVAPRVTFPFEPGIIVPNPTICVNSTTQFLNNTTQQSVLENRQFNFNKFAAYWAPTNTLMPVTDSIYEWIFTGSAPPTSTKKDPFMYFNTGGNQTASLSVNYWYSYNRGQGKLPKYEGTSATILVDASNIPPLAVTGATNICLGQSTTLTASGSSTFTWTNPPSNAASIVVAPTALTMYTVSANSGGCSAVNIITVQVSPAPTVQVSGPASACVGQAYVITATGAQSYSWSNQSTSPSQTLSSQTPGVMDYTVNGINGTCPYSTVVKSITIHALPSLTLSAPCKSLCTKASGGASITLNGKPAGGAFSGSGAAGTVAGAVFTPNNTGNTIVNYLYVDPATNCANNATLNITVVNCAPGTNVCATGLSEDLQGRVTVFPNPATSGVVYLRNLEGVTSLVVVNVLGEQVRREYIGSSEHRLDLSALPQGQYFVRLSNGAGESITVKIVNQH